MDDPAGFTELNKLAKPDNCTTCTCEQAGTCDVCESATEYDDTIENVVSQCQDRSPFKGLAHLLTTVKKYEFISLVENAYAQIGDKPFQLKATKDYQMSKEETDKAAKAFYEFLYGFLSENKVRVNEITQAFNLSTLGEVTVALSAEAQSDADHRATVALAQNESVMERIFSRSDFMREYMEVIKDTTDYPIGVMWLDDKSIKKERSIKNGKMVYNYQIQCDATRVDPCYFWATEDHQINHVGRAVFRLVQFTSGDIMRWIDTEVTGSSMISEGAEEFLELHEDGYRMHSAMLFDDHKVINKGNYDVMITRGRYKADNVRAMNVSIPESMKHEQYVPCEVYFSGSTILRCRVMETFDEHLGVHTTVFRRRGKSLFGYALHDFIYPFAKLYEGTIEGIDVSMGKTVGSLIQVDTGVLVDPDKYLTKNEQTGEVTLDLSSDQIIEFDSTEAFSSPNFKGVPIHVTQLPSDLAKLMPMLDMVFDQIEKISGIPSILVNSDNVSSALRTTGNFNASFQASSKGVKSLLREGETRIMEPSIQFFFDSKAMAGDFGNFLIELEPEILLSDTLTREFNDDQQLIQGAQTLAGLGGGLIPQERLAGLINTVGREVYRLNEDLIPNAGVLSTQSLPTPTGPV